MKHPDFIVFSRSKKKTYGLIIGKYQSHATPSLIVKKGNTLLREHRWYVPTVAGEVA
jgi:hypothetical protein